MNERITPDDVRDEAKDNQRQGKVLTAKALFDLADQMEADAKEMERLQDQLTDQRIETDRQRDLVGELVGEVERLREALREAKALFANRRGSFAVEVIDAALRGEPPESEDKQP